MKKTSKLKKPSESDIRSAVSILDAMSDSGHQVQAMVILKPMILTFEGTIEKWEDWHALFDSDSDLQIGLVPQMCDLIMFHPDGGVLLAWKDNVVLVDVTERSPEELLKMFPNISTLVN
jgi:hypothetical protein